MPNQASHRTRTRGGFGPVKAGDGKHGLPHLRTCSSAGHLRSQPLIASDGMSADRSTLTSSARHGPVGRIGAERIGDQGSDAIRFPSHAKLSDLDLAVLGGCALANDPRDRREAGAEGLRQFRRSGFGYRIEVTGQRALNPVGILAGGGKWSQPRRTGTPLDLQADPFGQGSEGLVGNLKVGLGQPEERLASSTESEELSS